MKRILLALCILLPLTAHAQKRHEYTFDFTKPAELNPPVIVDEEDYNGAEYSLRNTVLKSSDGMVTVTFIGRDEDGRGGVLKTGWLDEQTQLYDHFLFIARGGNMVVTGNGVQLDSLIFSASSFVGNLKLLSPEGVGLIDARNESWFSNGATGITELVYTNYGQVPNIRQFTVIYRSPMDVLVPVTVTPADKAEVHSIETIELSYADPVKLGANAKFELTGPRGFNPVLMDAQVVGKKVVLSLPDGVTIDESTVSRRGTYTLTIAAESIIGDDEDGYYNKKTTYTFKVVEAFNKFEKISVWPDDQVEQVTEIPNGIVVGFPTEIGKFSADDIKLVDREGTTIRTLKAQWLQEEEYTDEYPYYKHDKDIYTFVKFVFTGSKTAAVKATGIYHLTVPEGFIWNNNYDADAEDEGTSNGALFNPEFSIEYNVNGVVYPSDEVLQAAKDLLAITGAGYPAANSPSRLELARLVEEGIGADAVFEEAMAAFYAETLIEMPKDGYYLLSAVGSDGQEVFISYENGKVGLTKNVDDAAHLLAAVNTDDGTLVFETPDHKFLKQMMPTGTNVSEAKGKANKLTFSRLILKDDNGHDIYTPQQLFGLWSISGIIGTNDEQQDIIAYTLVNLQTLSFATDRDKSLRYFSTTETNAFRLTETNEPIPAATYTLDPASGTSLEALQRIVITFTNINEVSVVENAKSLITLVGTNTLKYNPTKVNLIEGKKNQYLLYFEDVKAGNFTLTIPKGTFTWTFDSRKANIQEITASYIVKSGIDFNFDYEIRHRIYYPDLPLIDIPMRDQDLGSFHLFINEKTPFIPDTNREITITDLDLYKVIARGHLEQDPSYNNPDYPEATALRFVLDEPRTITPGSIPPDVYQYNFFEGCMGDENFGKWLKDPQSISKRDCHVNNYLYPMFTLDNDRANLVFSPKAGPSAAFITSLSDVVISFPYYQKVEIVGENTVKAVNTLYNDEIVSALEPVEGSKNSFRFTSTEPLRAGLEEGEYLLTIPKAMFKCGESDIVPFYQDLKVYYYGKGGGDIVDGIEAAPQSDIIFDLSGRRVKDISKSGVYIINGKKVLVK